jgi:ribosomal protein S18 acetylase RimI-like enzyme
VTGSTAQAAPLWRALGPADVPAVDALHRRALGTLDDHGWVRAEETAFFAAVLGPDGFGLGVEAAGRLVAYGLVQTRLEAEDLAALPWPGMPEAAKLCGAAVDPQWRGRGLQAALAAERLRRGRALGFSRFFATAAPGNVASWVSLLHAGMQVAVLGPRYGGLLRYTLVADGCVPEGEAKLVPLADEAGQAACLADGWRGTRLLAGPPPALELRPCAG